MGNSYDNNNQDQQQSNGGILALFGFIMFWSMAGGHGAEPAVRPRPSPGGEIRPPPLDPPGRLPLRRKGPALVDISDALREYTRPVRDLLSRSAPPSLRRHAPASATQTFAPAERSLSDATPDGNDVLMHLGEARISPGEVESPIGSFNGLPELFRGYANTDSNITLSSMRSVGSHDLEYSASGRGSYVVVNNDNVSLSSTTSSFEKITDIPRAISPVARRTGSAITETSILGARPGSSIARGELAERALFETCELL